MRAAFLALIGTIACSEAAPAEPPAPPDAVLELDAQGFHLVSESGVASVEDNVLRLPAEQDVVVELRSELPVVSLSIPAYELRWLVRGGQPTRQVLRTWPCSREDGCRFDMRMVIGADRGRVDAAMRVMPNTPTPSTR